MDTSMMHRHASDLGAQGNFKSVSIVGLVKHWYGRPGPAGLSSLQKATGLFVLQLQVFISENEEGNPWTVSQNTLSQAKTPVVECPLETRVDSDTYDGILDEESSIEPFRPTSSILAAIGNGNSQDPGSNQRLFQNRNQLPWRSAGPWSSLQILNLQDPVGGVLHSLSPGLRASQRFKVVVAGNITRTQHFQRFPNLGFEKPSIYYVNAGRCYTFFIKGHIWCYLVTAPIDEFSNPSDMVVTDG
ncbi:hypothetical protein FB446DRAFT_803679 [Lentinula raphanica]|nr:hypothetical protein FB446DRAFT_803679 [Lentinula raphanica]